jgi:hypothetical protein
MLTDQNYPVLLYTNNRSRINDKWVLHTAAMQNIITSFPADSSVKNFSDPYDIGPYENDHALFQQAFLQIVTETVFDYPVVSFTEKTFKPIVNKRPFVMLGAPGSIDRIQSLGFKTFNKFWSEDYDNIQDPEQRLLAVVDIVDNISSMSINELQDLCISMEDVLNYNFNHYVNNFKNNELKKLEQMCIENLKSRYD